MVKNVLLAPNLCVNYNLCVNNLFVYILQYQKTTLFIGRKITLQHEFFFLLFENIYVWKCHRPKVQVHIK